MKLVCLRVSFGFLTRQVPMYFSKFSTYSKIIWRTIDQPYLFVKTRFKVFLHLGFRVSGCGFGLFELFSFPLIFLLFSFSPLLSWSFYFLSPSSFPLFFSLSFYTSFFPPNFFLVTHMHNRLHMLSCFFNTRFDILKRNVI